MRSTRTRWVVRLADFGVCTGLMLLAGACSRSDETRDANVAGPRLLVDLDLSESNLNSAPSQSVPLLLGIFLSTREFSGDRGWSTADAEEIVRGLLADAAEVLAPCGLSPTIETAQVIVLPADLFRFQGNERGSLGGHPPPGVAEPEQFNYERDEALTEEARLLFSYGKTDTAPNTIAVYTVERVAYWIGDERVPAGGLSFPPNLFHRVEDYPLRNSVVISATHPLGGRLPQAFAPDALAHELAHMLLNTGLHIAAPSNLMSEFGGTSLTEEQCRRMRQNLRLLFGEDAVPDPGPPSSSDAR